MRSSPHPGFFLYTLLFPLFSLHLLDFVLSEIHHEVHWSMLEAMQSSHACRTDRNTPLLGFFLYLFWERRRHHGSIGCYGGVNKRKGRVDAAGGSLSVCNWWPYLELLLLLLLLVDACKSEKRIRHRVRWWRRQPHDWPDLTILMQLTSVIQTGASGSRQRGWKVSWNM